MSSRFPADEIPSWLHDYLRIEEAATEIRVHSPYVICGLFQTADYAAAIARSVGVTSPDDEYIERTVRLRKVRQRRVHSGELAVVAIQPEFALRLNVGSSITMATQLASLAELCELPNVTVHVMPYDVGQYEALRIGSFSLLSTPHMSTPAVHVEGHDGGQLIVTAAESDHFVAAFDHARRLALPSDESQRFIMAMRQEWEKKDD